MRHSLVVIFDTPHDVAITDDMCVRGKGEIDISSFLDNILADMKAAKVESFVVTKFGADTAQAIEDCQDVYTMAPSGVCTCRQFVEAACPMCAPIQSGDRG